MNEVEKARRARVEPLEKELAQLEAQKIEAREPVWLRAVPKFVEDEHEAVF